MIECPHCGRKRHHGNSCRGCGRVDLEAIRSIQVSPAAVPSRRNSIPPRRPNNSFEKGTRLDERGLPYLDKNAKPLKMKESFDKRHYERGGRQTIRINTSKGDS